MLFVIALLKGWDIWQYDVENAFVYTDIDQEIYVI